MEALDHTWRRIPMLTLLCGHKKHIMSTDLIEADLILGKVASCDRDIINKLGSLSN